MTNSMDFSHVAKWLSRLAWLIISFGSDILVLTQTPFFLLLVGISLQNSKHLIIKYFEDE